MGSIPLPALDVRTQQEDPLSQYAKVVNLKSMLQQQQTQQQIAPLQIQEAQQKAQVGQMQLQDQPSGRNTFAVVTLTHKPVVALHECRLQRL